MTSKKVGKYLIEAEIGRGQFGTVYRGRNTQTDEAVAVKTIDRTQLTEKSLQQIEREISVMKGVNSPHLIRLVDVLKTAKNLYLFLEFCPGGDLEEHLKKSGVFSEILVKRWLTQFLLAFDELQAKKIIHRDLKLANILLTDSDSETGSIKIADFGFARFVSEVSQAQTKCGSPLYMAPEIFAANPTYNFKADIWSLGAIIFELLTGKPAFMCKNIQTLIVKQRQGVEFPAERPLSPEIVDLIQKMLTHDPAERIDFVGIKAHPFCVNDIVPPDAVSVREVSDEEVKQEHLLSELSVQVEASTTLEAKLAGIESQMAQIEVYRSNGNIDRTTDLNVQQTAAQKLSELMQQTEMTMSSNGLTRESSPAFANLYEQIQIQLMETQTKIEKIERQGTDTTTSTVTPTKTSPKVGSGKGNKVEKVEATGIDPKSKTISRDMS